MEPLTSSGVSLVSGWLWAARRAMAPARMLLRLIWRSGGGPPRGWPRTMMAQPDKTCEEEDGVGESMAFRIDSEQSRCGDSDATSAEKSRGWKEEATVSSRFLPSLAANGCETCLWWVSSQLAIKAGYRFGPKLENSLR